ncbi:hypothetical protein JCM14469_12510 [Desulfatiferula olefinivorans]
MTRPEPPRLPLLVITRSRDLTGLLESVLASGYAPRVVDDTAAAADLVRRQTFPLVMVDDAALTETDASRAASLNALHGRNSQLILVRSPGEARIFKGVDEVIDRPLDPDEVMFRLKRARRIILLEHALRQALHRKKADLETPPEDRSMDTLGRLTAGVMHEINTPVQYVGDNLHFLDDGIEGLFEVLDRADALCEAARQGRVPETLIEAFQTARRKADSDYLKKEIPESIRQSLQGVEQISGIVLAIRNLSGRSLDDNPSVDVRSVLSICVLLTRNQWKKSAELETRLDPDLPNLRCRTGAFNQVAVNLIINAAHAVDEARSRDASLSGRIIIETGREGDMGIVRISDNGAGIPDEILPRIFDPFFTTKKEGKGTGQGLSISRAIVEAHGGRLTVETRPGVGSTFVIALPLAEDRPALPSSSVSAVPAHQDASRRRILFVDDQKEVLDGIARMLRPMEGAWDMRFTCSGREALSLLEKDPADVVVSDFNMQGMNGLDFFREVKARHPETLRIMLSGEITRNFIMKSVRLVHQFIAKPAGADLLKTTISRACDLKGLLADDELRRTVAGMDSLPSLPEIYAQISRELQSPEASMKKVGALIAKDTAISAKILQMVNSAFFGLPGRIAGPEQAVMLLGADTVRALVLHCELFSTFRVDKRLHRFLERLSSHNLHVAHLARRIAEHEKKDRAIVDQAFMGGLLHDFGKLILAGQFPDRYLELLNQTAGRGLSYNALEQETFKTGHGAIGAYLAGIWGFPLPIVNAIFHHHDPLNIDEDSLGPATAVYVANALCGRDAEGPDQDFLTHRDLASRCDAWRGLA